MIIHELEEYRDKMVKMKDMLIETKKIEYKISSHKLNVVNLFNSLFKGLNPKNVIVTDILVSPNIYSKEYLTLNQDYFGTRYERAHISRAINDYGVLKEICTTRKDKIIKVLTANKRDKFIDRFNRFCEMFDEFNKKDTNIKTKNVPFKRKIRSQDVADRSWRGTALDGDFRSFADTNIERLRFDDGYVKMFEKGDEALPVSLDPEEIKDFVVVQQHYDDMMNALTDYHTEISEIDKNIADYITDMKSELAQYILLALL